MFQVHERALLFQCVRVFVCPCGGIGAAAAAASTAAACIWIVNLSISQRERDNSKSPERGCKVGVIHQTFAPIDSFDKVNKRLSTAHTQRALSMDYIRLHSLKYT